MAKQSTNTTTGAGDDPTTSVSLPVIDGAACRGKHTTIRKSKSGPRRAIVLATVQILMIVHLIQWAVTGRTLSPVEPSESMEFVKHGVVNAGAIFFALALLSTLIFGRWFCGWGCHLVMLQDLCAWMMKKIGIRPKPFRSRLLLYVPFVLAVYMFVWPAVRRLGVEPLSAWLHDTVAFIPAMQPSPAWHGFTSEIITEHFWETFPTWIVAIPFILVCGFATVYFLGAKGLCTYACPYGGFFAPVDQYSPARIRVTDACEQCGHCTAVCTSNVRVHEEVHAYGMVVDPGCMKCLDCVSVCPNGALHYGFGKPAAMRGAPRAAEPKRHYDLTWPEEIGLLVVFTASFFAVRGVYEVVPMLMAAGVAICVTWIAWKTWRCLRDPSANLHRFRLKYHGKLTASGYVFLALAALVLGVTAHSGVVRVLRAGADRADWRVTISKHQVFTVNRVALPASMDADAAEAIRRYELADAFWRGGIGLLPYSDTDVRTAWLYACRGDFATAEARLRRHLSRREAEATARDLGLILFARLKNDEAETYYVEMLEKHPDWAEMSDDFAQWLESEGRVDEAIARTETALAHQPAGSAEHLMVLRRLSLLRRAAGDLDGSIELIRETIELVDDNPYAYGALAETLTLRGDFEEAASTMEHAVTLAEEQQLPAASRAFMHRQLAVMFNQVGRTLEAAQQNALAEQLEASGASVP